MRMNDKRTRLTAGIVLCFVWVMICAGCGSGSSGGISKEDSGGSVTDTTAVKTVGTSASRGDEFAEKRSSTLTTTLNSDNQLTFTTQGDTITVSGISVGYPVRNIYVVSATADITGRHAQKAFSLTQTGETIQGSLTYKPPKSAKKFMLVVEHEQGGDPCYIIKYAATKSDSAGFYFPDNGLAEKNAAVMQKIRNVPAVAAQLYIDANGDDITIRDTLAEVRKLGESITKGHTTDYDKAHAISKWVSENIYYDNSAKNNSVTAETISLSGVLNTRRTICYGFSNLTAAICQSVGIKAVCIDGVSQYFENYENLLTGGELHNNTAYFDDELGRYVIMDAGWDCYNEYNGEYIRTPAIDYYFDGSPLFYSFSHRFTEASYIDFFGALE
ncbi:hypothetical protein FACS1894120_2550 [Clostridia bacterium]|nr:hypothetical protein FACS1894120_2550 [Clostridia bacterium]